MRRPRIPLFKGGESVIRLSLGRRWVDLLPVAQRTNACLYNWRRRQDSAPVTLQYGVVRLMDFAILQSGFNLSERGPCKFAVWFESLRRFGSVASLPIESRPCFPRMASQRTCIYMFREAIMISSTTVLNLFIIKLKLK